MGCPVPHLTPSTLELFKLWALCDGKPLELFGPGGGILAADNRTVEGLKVLEAEADKIRGSR